LKVLVQLPDVEKFNKKLDKIDALVKGFFQVAPASPSTVSFHARENVEVFRDLDSRNGEAVTGAAWAEPLRVQGELCERAPCDKAEAP